MEPADLSRPGSVMTTLWLLWAALVGGVVSFAAIIAFLVAGDVIVGMDLPPVIEYLPLGVLLVLGVIGYAVRLVILRRHLTPQGLKPEGYFAGHFALLIFLETAALFSLVVVLLTGQFWPASAATALSLALMLLNWPRRDAIQPQPMDSLLP